MPRLLVVHHSPTRSMQALVSAILDGAGDDAIEGVEVLVRPALEATAEDMGQLLVVHHAPTPATQALLDAALEGARHDQITGVTVVESTALATTAEELLAADGYLLLCTANFGYMSGAMKHMFDSTFLQIGGSLAEDGAPSGSRDASTAGRPFGLLVHGRYDTTGAVRSVLSIVQALDWRQSAATVEVLGDPSADHLETARDLGGTLAALLSE